MEFIAAFPLEARQPELEQKLTSDSSLNIARMKLGPGSHPRVRLALSPVDAAYGVGHDGRQVDLAFEEKVPHVAIEVNAGQHFVPLALETSPDRRVTAKRRFLHDDKSGALKMAHDALRGYFGHVFVGVVLSLAPLEFQSEGNRVGEVVGIGGGELVGVGHRVRLEQTTNEGKACTLRTL
jgi:hypothetical protein